MTRFLLIQKHISLIVKNNCACSDRAAHKHNVVRVYVVREYIQSIYEKNRLTTNGYKEILRSASTFSPSVQSSYRSTDQRGSHGNWRLISLRSLVQVFVVRCMPKASFYFSRSSHHNLADQIAHALTYLYSLPSKFIKGMSISFVS